MARKRRKRITCPNCEKQLKGDMNFCPSCGQENHIKRVSMKMLFSDFFTTYFTVDSKLLKSLKYLLIKPSFLSLEYLDGKIEAYLRPIRLYIFISFSFFLLLSITSSNDLLNGFSDDDLTNFRGKFNDELQMQVDSTDIKEVLKELDPLVVDEGEDVKEQIKNPSLPEGDIVTLLDNFEGDFFKKLKKVFSNKREINSFINYGKSKLPLFSFFLIPVLGGLFFLFFYKKNYYYVDHLVFALHLQSFLFVLLIIGVLVNLIFAIELYTVVFLGTLIYGFIAGIRFYKRSWISTFIRLSIIGLVHSVLSLSVFMFFVFLVFKYYQV